MADGIPGCFRLPAGMVLVDGATASYVAWLMTVGIVETKRKDGYSVDPRLIAVRDIFRRAADEWSGTVSEGAAFQERTKTFQGRKVSEPPEAIGARVPPMTTSEVARRLGRTPQAVTGLARRRTLPGVQSGSTWLFERADVEDYCRRKTGAA